MNIIKKRKNSEIEYEISNDALKEKHTKISEILDKTRESKMKINSERNNVLVEFKNLQKKDFMKSSDKSVDGMIKNNMDNKEIDIENRKNNNFLFNKKCNIY